MTTNKEGMNKDIIECNTWQDIFKKHKPEITDKEIDHILWNETCYPFGSAEMILKQIEEFFNKQKIHDGLD